MANTGSLPTSKQLNIIEIDSANLSLANLKSAIDTAGTTTQPDLIVVRTTNTANTIEYATTDDTVSIDIDMETYGSLSIVGLGTQRLTLDANKYCQVMAITTQSTVNLGNLMITGGEDLVGGGICNSGMLTVTNSTISGNTASGSHSYSGSGNGGGIYSDGTLTVTDSTISKNTVSGYGGGGGICSRGTLTVTDSTISKNTVSDYGGGGIYSYGTLTVTNSTIGENTVSGDYGGGGICSEDGTLTVTNSTISGNTALDATRGGGGICIWLSTLTVTNSTISENTVSGGSGGGGICVWFAGDTFRACSRNSA